MFLRFIANYIIRGGYMKYEINENIISLEKQFKKIKKLGYIKCNYYDSGAPGRMFEILLNKKPDNLRAPDYGNIEIKTLLKENFYNLTLFSLMPKLDNMDFEQKITYFFKVFYYEIPDKNKALSNPHFYLTVDSKHVVYLKGKLIFKLIFDDVNCRLILSYYNRNCNSYNKIIYWNYSDIINIFMSKLNFLAIVKYNKYVVKKIIYVHYYELKIYNCIDKNNIINLLKSGDVYIKFNISSKKNSSHEFVPYYHGVEFILKSDCIDKLFHHLKSY